MRRTTLTPLSTLVLLVAGCAAAPTPAGPEGAKPVEVVSEFHGAIQGFVLTAELFPIPDAVVEAFRGSELIGNASTGPDGAFVFPLLDPATYRLRAHAALSRPNNVTVDVRAGEVSHAKVLLAAEGSPEPYLLTLHRRGFQPCALAAVVTPASFAAFCGNDRSANYFDIPDGYVAIVLETVWPGSSEEASNFFYCCNGTQQTANGKVRRILDYTWGLPPSKSVLIPGVQNKKPAGPVGEQYGPTPNGTAFRLESKVFWTGYFAQHTQGAMPACSQLSYGRCSGAGFHPGFSFEMWFTVFVNGLRDGTDLAKFSALPDA